MFPAEAKTDKFERCMSYAATPHVNTLLRAAILDIVMHFRECLLAKTYIATPVKSSKVGVYFELVFRSTRRRNHNEDTRSKQV